ncbi:flavin oxidoreductase [Marivirga lumbricoides]|uniref:Flavin oxidoreductase n=1 Tax=Marivirga lumbricoides TaxID=1046115 RepID=A0ABQ1M8V5_9BACT|nr:flavin oxidoreductase [Marivirga lumbricoides]
MEFNQEEIKQLDSRYRANLFNTLSGYKSANLISTISERGISNLAIFNSVIHIGANPQLMGFILRPTTVERHTYNNILHSSYYTINQIHKGIFEEAHQTSAKYERNVSEFEKCSLNEEYLADFPVPFVQQSKIKIGLKFVEEHFIHANDTRLIVGEVLKVSIAEQFISEDGSVDHPAAETVAISGLDTYLEAIVLNKLSYSRT